MTTILEQMQTGPVKANEIFAKLADTSMTAVKTRERLFSELKGELDRQAKFEEQRLFPVLEKHEETKGLVGQAHSDSQRMRELLGEIEGAPKDSEAFGAKLTELRDLFQRHLREDGKEFLPAILKALSEEEAATAEKSEAETGAPARRAGGGNDRREAEHEAAEAARPAADIVKAGTELAQQGARVARVAMGAGADRGDESDRAARSVMVPEDTQARMADTASIGRSVVALLNEQTQLALQVQTVMAAGRARTLAELAQVQSALMAASFHRMGAFNDRYLALIRSWGGLLSFPSSHR